MKVRSRNQNKSKHIKREEAPLGQQEHVAPSKFAIVTSSKWDTRSYIDSRSMLTALMKEKHLFEFCYMVPRYDLSLISQFVKNYRQSKTEVNGHTILLTEDLIAQVTGVQSHGLKWVQRGTFEEFNGLCKTFFGDDLPPGCSTQKGIPVAAFPPPWDALSVILLRHICMRSHPSYIYTVHLRCLVAWKEGQDVNLASFLLDGIDSNIVGWKSGRERKILYPTLLQQIINFVLLGKTSYRPELVCGHGQKFDEQTEPRHDEGNEAVGLLKDAASLLEVSNVGLQQENQRLMQENGCLKQKCVSLEVQLSTECTERQVEVQRLHDEIDAMSQMVYEAKDDCMRTLEHQLMKLSLRKQQNSENETIGAMRKKCVELDSQVKGAMNLLEHAIHFSDLQLECRAPPVVYALMYKERALALTLGSFLTKAPLWSHNAKNVEDFWLLVDDKDKNLLAEMYLAGDICGDPCYWNAKHLMGSAHGRAFLSIVDAECERF